jgi:hypothetical protein
MEVYRPLRGGLFVYECIRLFFLVGAFVALRPGEGAMAFPWLACVVPNALFPLMTLFLWVDASNYAGYRPLYISGKCISLVSEAAWFVFSRQDLYAAVYGGGRSVLIIIGILGIISGDTLSTAAGFFITRKPRGRAESAPAFSAVEKAEAAAGVAVDTAKYGGEQ